MSPVPPFNVGSHYTVCALINFEWGDRGENVYCHRERGQGWFIVMLRMGGRIILAEIIVLSLVRLQKFLIHPYNFLMEVHRKADYVNSL